MSHGCLLVTSRHSSSAPVRSHTIHSQQQPIPSPPQPIYRLILHYPSMLNPHHHVRLNPQCPLGFNPHFPLCLNLTDLYPKTLILSMLEPSLSSAHVHQIAASLSNDMHTPFCLSKIRQSNHPFLPSLPPAVSFKVPLPQPSTPPPYSSPAASSAAAS
jgi:hypothetical protein